MEKSNIKILAIIPARGGSKSVPKKNIRNLNGKPLIAYTIEAAKRIEEKFHKIIVSTDDEEIAEVAKHYGADVPFIRPSNLAEDKTPTYPVLQHAVNFVEKDDGINIDLIMLLQPTAPFRTTEDMLNCLNLSQTSNTDSVISVVQVFSYHPILMKKIENNRLTHFSIEEKEGTPRQLYEPPAYMRNGAIYITKRNNLIEQNSIWGNSITPYVMPQERSYNIDDEIDFITSEMMMKKSTKK
ncbi:MAG: acylneuraminate cytidylyltransferase family protein [SAR202 cluster bacterium]|nr:acylneuraminate cytidylyltransferase family protein [SAR202 cluster bacterium]